MMKTTLKKAALGFLMGMAVGNLIAIITAIMGDGELFSEVLRERAGNEAMALLAQTLLSGTLGAVAMACMVFYDLERWGIVRAAVTHYALYTVTFLLVGLYLGWVETTFEMAFMATVFALGFLVVTISMYAKYRAEVQRLNELLVDTRTD